MSKNGRIHTYDAKSQYIDPRMNKITQNNSTELCAVATKGSSHVKSVFC